MIGSIIVGGLLFIILLRMNEISTQNTFTYSDELIVQQNLVSVVQLIEYDFRKIGFCANPNNAIPPALVITYADTSRIDFWTDVATTGNHFGDGTPDKISYYLGDTTELRSTPNELDRKLYRVVNNETPKSANLGVTQFRLHYFDTNGIELISPVANPGSIQTIQINLKVENPYAFNKRYTIQQSNTHSAQYNSAFWRQIRLAAKNLRFR